MAKSADAFRTISEVADWLETPAHVLRFWESKFTQVKPVKRAGGRRYYRPADMLLLGGIKKLLHDDGLTIKGVQKLLREKGIKHVSGQSEPLDDITAAEVHDIAAKTQSNPVSAPASTILDFQREDTSLTDADPAEAVVVAEDTQAVTTDNVHHDAPTPVTASIPASEPPAVVTPPEPTPVDADPSPKDANAEDTTAQDNDVEDTPSQGDGIEDTGSQPAAVYKSSRAPANEVPTQEPQDEPPAADDTPVMPSFSHRSAETPAAPEVDVALQTEPVVSPAPKPIKVDVADDPDDDITAGSGVLSQLAGMNAPIQTDLADRLAPILGRLRQIRQD